MPLEIFAFNWRRDGKRKGTRRAHVIAFYLPPWTPRAQRPPAVVGETLVPAGPPARGGCDWTQGLPTLRPRPRGSTAPRAPREAPPSPGALTPRSFSPSSSNSSEPRSDMASPQP